MASFPTILTRQAKTEDSLNQFDDLLKARQPRLDALQRQAAPPPAPEPMVDEPSMSGVFQPPASPLNALAQDAGAPHPPAPVPAPAPDGGILPAAGAPAPESPLNAMSLSAPDADPRLSADRVGSGAESSPSVPAGDDLSRFDAMVKDRYPDLAAKVAPSPPTDDLAKFDAHVQDRYGISPAAERRSTTGEAAPTEGQGFDFPTPEPPAPGQNLGVNLGGAPGMARATLPFNLQKPTPPDEEQQQRVLAGKMPVETAEQATGGLVRHLTKQGESLPAAAEGQIPGAQFTTGEDDLARAFRQGLIDQSGMGGSVRSMAHAAGEVAGGGDVLTSAPARRMYHGTGSAFDRPDAAKFDPNGLYGPGYYLTSEPRVADSYAGARNETKAAAEATLENLRKAQAETSPEYRASYQADIDRVQANLAAMPPGGPNVRAVDVPGDLRLLDADALLSQVDKEAIAAAIARTDPHPAASDAAQHLLRGDITGGDLYEQLVGPIQGGFITGGHDQKAGVNALLREAGYDGIRYAGGKRVPIADAAGKPIEHDAVVVFPQSMQKLRNTLSGTEGGQIRAEYAAGLGAGAAGALAASQVVGAGEAPSGGSGVGGSFSGDPMERLRVRSGLPPRRVPVPDYPIPDAVAKGIAALGTLRSGADQLADATGLTAWGEEARRQSIDEWAARTGQPREEVAQLYDQALELGMNVASAAPKITTGAPKIATAAMPRIATTVARAAPAAPDLLEKGLAWTQSNMLSGPKTLAVNLVGGGVETLNRPLIELLEGRPRDAATDLGAMGQALGRAWAAGAEAFTTGVRPSAAKGATSAMLEGARPEAFAGKTGVAATPALRVLGATDEFVRTVNEAGAMAVAAQRAAKTTGRGVADLLANPTPEMEQFARTAGDRAVLQGTGTPLGQLLTAGRNLVHSTNPDPVQRAAERATGVGFYILTPFVKIPEQVLLRGTKMTVGPVAYPLKTAYHLAKGETDLARNAAAKAALTTASAYIIYGQVESGNITGNGPPDPTKRALLMAARGPDGNPVWRPHSLRVGGRWFDYTNLGPVAVPMAAIASAYEEAQTEGRKPGATTMKQLDKVADGVAKTMMDASYVKTLADVMKLLAEGRGGEVPGSLAGNVLSRLVPYGGLVSTVSRTADETVKEPANPLEATLARTPLSGLVPDKIGPYGEPVESPQDVVSVLSPFRTEAPGRYDPAAAEVARLVRAGQSVQVPVYGRNETYKGAEQTPAQRTALQTTAGQAARVYVAAMIADPRYQALPDAKKAASLNAMLGTAAEVADQALGDRVARSPEWQARIALASKPHYRGVEGTPAEIRKRNYEISTARSLLEDYRTRYPGGGGREGEARMREEMPVEYDLARTRALPKRVLDRTRAEIDRTFDGALTRAERQGILGAGNTIVPIGEPDEPGP